MMLDDAIGHCRAQLNSAMQGMGDPVIASVRAMLNRERNRLSFVVWFEEHAELFEEIGGGPFVVRADLAAPVTYFDAAAAECELLRGPTWTMQ